MYAIEIKKNYGENLIFRTSYSDFYGMIRIYASVISFYEEMYALALSLLI